MPGSEPTATYAATVAARRTSGAAVRWRASASAAVDRSSSGLRLRVVSSWSRNAVFAPTTRPAYDRKHG